MLVFLYARLFAKGEKIIATCHRYFSSRDEGSWKFTLRALFLVTRALFRNIFDVAEYIPVNLGTRSYEAMTLRKISDYSTSNYNSQEYSKRNSSPGCYAGINEYDHPREIIVDLSRSIYREIHNLFNLPAGGRGSDSA